MRRSHFGAMVALCMLLATAIPVSGCQQRTSMQPGQTRTAGAESPAEPVAYTNDEFAFAAQFPAEPGKVGWADLDSVVFTSEVGEVRTDVSVWPVSGEKRSNFSKLSEADLRRWMSESLGMALSSVIIPAGGVSDSDLSPSIQFGNTNGQPSATAVEQHPIVIMSSDGPTGQKDMWLYATVVFRDDGRILSLSGIRETKDQAVAAAGSLRLLAAPNAPSESQQSPSQAPDGAIKWTEAGRHVGEKVTVYGPVAGSKYASTSNNQPTYIDIGARYPDPDRVSMVVWGEDRSNFPGSPEDMYLGKTVSVTGEVYIYSGACNIKVESPSQIRVIEK